MSRFRSIAWRLAAGAVLATASAALASHGEEVARIATHSQRYGAHIGISAYDDPLLKGVTCYVSGAHAGNQLGGSQPERISDATVSCLRVGKLSAPAKIPTQAQVFDKSVDPVFDAVHVVRILDAKRLTVLYFSYTESGVAGDLPGHIDIIRLPEWGNRLR